MPPSAKRVNVIAINIAINTPTCTIYIISSNAQKIEAVPSTYLSIRYSKLKGMCALRHAAAEPARSRRSRTYGLRGIYTACWVELNDNDIP